MELKIDGDWGLGIGDWGLGIGDWAHSPIPNPQSPIPNPHFLNYYYYEIFILINLLIIKIKKFILVQKYIIIYKIKL